MLLEYHIKQLVQCGTYVNNYFGYRLLLLPDHAIKRPMKFTQWKLKRDVDLYGDSPKKYFYS